MASDKRPEPFSVSAQVLLPAPLTIDQREFTQTLVVSEFPQIVGAGLELRFIDATHIDAHWTQEHPISEETLDRLDNPDHLFLLSGGKGLDIADNLRRVLFTLFVKLACDAGTVAFLDEFRNAKVVSLITRVEYTVRDETNWTVPQLRYGNREGRPPPLSWEHARGRLLLPLKRHESFIVEADYADWRWDSGSSLVNLATALEIAAYEFITPNGIFGPSWLDQPSFRATSEESYIACHELLGARHEYAHLGNLLVRIFDPASNRVVRTNTRPLVVESHFEQVGMEVIDRRDYVMFRRGVVDAVAWMRTLLPPTQ